jgi:hypothetical protein
MLMSTEVLTLTEKAIDQAVAQRDVFMLEKESLFALSNFSCTASEVFSDIVYSFKPFQVKFIKEPNVLFQTEYISSLKDVVRLNNRLYENKVDYMDAYLHFIQWFYQATTEGIITAEYRSEHLVSITDASEELGVSRTMMYKYIDRGLETVGEKGSKKIPRFVLEAWKKPDQAFIIHFIHAVRKARTQTVEEKLDNINQRISEFEIEYEGTFYQLFGSLSVEEIDSMDEAVDIFDWKKLEEEKRALLKRVKGRK